LSFARAADELAITPTAVSHQIRSLELDLGRPLFRRQPRPIHLTPEGEALANAAREAFDGVAGIWATLKGPSTDRPLIVSTTRALASAWLVPRLARIKAELDLDLEVEASEEARDLHAGGVDLALRYRRAPPEHAEAQVLFRDQFIAVAHPHLIAAPLDSAAGLSRVRLVHARWARSELDLPTWRHYLESLSASDATAREIDPDAGVHLSEESQAIAAALAGQGVALVSAMLAKDALREGRLVQVLSQTLPGASLYAVWLPVSPVIESISRLVEWFRRELAGSSAVGESPIQDMGAADSPVEL
jgi:LysR family glycine cleavage system transcriptional activator